MISMGCHPRSACFCSPSHMSLTRSPNLIRPWGEQRKWPLGTRDARVKNNILTPGGVKDKRNHTKCYKWQEGLDNHYKKTHYHQKKTS
jgi:hypothetical protein